jgi:hypothetical protein
VNDGLAIARFRDWKLSLARDARPKPDDHDFDGLATWCEQRPAATNQHEGGIMPPVRHPIFSFLAKATCPVSG